MSNFKFTRKRFLQMAAATQPAASHFASAAVALSGSNILTVMTDQHRRDYMTAARESLIVPTPNIDRIAASKAFVSLTRCASTPVTAASRDVPVDRPLLPLHRHHQQHRSVARRRPPWRITSQRRIPHGPYWQMHFNDAHTHGFHYHLGFKLVHVSGSEKCSIMPMRSPIIPSVRNSLTP